jgi:hypothetical protein
VTPRLDIPQGLVLVDVKERRVATRSPNSTATGASRNSDAADWRFARNLDKLYPLGPRIFALILGRLGETSFRMTEIEALVARFAALDPETLRALGADRWPPRPDLRIVGGREP